MTKRMRRILFNIGGMGSALGVSFGVVFGLAATQNSVRYLDYNMASIAPVAGQYGDAHNDNKPQVTNKEADNPYTSPWDSQTDPQQKIKSIQQILDGSTHQIMDESFNQSSFLGMASWVQATDNPSLENYKDLSLYSGKLTPDLAHAEKPISDLTSGFIQTYLAAINNPSAPAKTLVLPGYNHATPLQTLANSYTTDFNKAGYIFLDFDAGYFGDTVSHIASVLFRADQSAMLAAISACQYLNDNFDAYYAPSHPLAIGTYGGNPIPTVTNYMGGFELGAYLYNKVLEANYPKYPLNAIDKYNDIPSSNLYYKKQ